MEELFTNTYRNILSDIDETTTSPWSDTVGDKDDEPIHPETTDKEAEGNSFDKIDGNIEIRQPIASGGQARISQAFDMKFCRTIAVKSLHDELKVRPEYRRAFIAEAKVTAQLEHPAIIPVYGLYEDNGSGLHLSMKLVRGRTLKDYIRRIRKHYQKISRKDMIRSERTLLWKRLNIFLRVCEAISYVHHRQVIHRDLKPENIMLGSFNETYVMDWGIAEYHEPGKKPSSSKEVAGTLQYIAPEVIRKEPYDQRSDIFLLGLILYEIVFLKRAYPTAETREEAIENARNCWVEPFEHFYHYKVDKDLKMIIAKAMAPDPTKRYQTVQELAADLSNYEMYQEVSANPDKLGGRVFRRVRNHYKLLMVLCLLLLFSFTVVISMSLYREVEHRRLLNFRDRAMADIYSKGIYACTRFDRQFKGYESILESIAGETLLLFRSNPQKPHARFYTYKDSLNPATYPPDCVYAPTFQTDISLGSLLFIHPESGRSPSPAITNDIYKLFYLDESMRAAVVNSLGNVIAPNTSVEEQNDIILNHVTPPIALVYVGLENGLHVSYPFRTDYPRDYDPRPRGWYVDAKKNPAQTVWSVPYIDSTTAETQIVVISCSKAIVGSDKKILGVAAVDIMLSKLINMLSATGNVGSYIDNKLLIDVEGNIIADSRGRWTARAVDAETLEFHKVPNQSLLEKMWKEKNGWTFMEENGVNYLYFYLEIETLNWIYVERINFEEMLKGFNG